MAHQALAALAAYLAIPEATAQTAHLDFQDSAALTAAMVHLVSADLAE
jgi:hypothetical protein